jgi:hypothetical protein
MKCSVPGDDALCQSESGERISYRNGDGYYLTAEKRKSWKIILSRQPESRLSQYEKNYAAESPLVPAEKTACGDRPGNNQAPGLVSDRENAGH